MAKPTTLTIDLEGHPGEYVTISRKIGGRRKVAINSATNPSEVIGVDENNNPVFRPSLDFNSGAWEAFVQATTHPDAHWTCRDENGKPLSRDRVTIENNTKYEDAFVAASPKAYAFVMGMDDQSAEGNDDGSPPQADGESNSKTSTAHRRNQRK